MWQDFLQKHEISWGDSGISSARHVSTNMDELVFQRIQDLNFRHFKSCTKQHNISSAVKILLIIFKKKKKKNGAVSKECRHLLEKRKVQKFDPPFSGSMHLSMVLPPFSHFSGSFKSSEYVFSSSSIFEEIVVWIFINRCGFEEKKRKIGQKRQKEKRFGSFRRQKFWFYKNFRAVSATALMNIDGFILVVLVVLEQH